MRFEEGGQGSGTLYLEGDLTVERAAELKQELAGAIERADRLVLDFGGVTSIDLSFLQLMCSAHKTAAGSGKEIAQRGSRPDVVRKTVEASGFTRHKGCTRQTEKSCLWMVNNYGGGKTEQ